MTQRNFFQKPTLNKLVSKFKKHNLSIYILKSKFFYIMGDYQVSSNFLHHYDHIWLENLDQCPWKLYGKDRYKFIQILENSGEYSSEIFENLVNASGAGTELSNEVSPGVDLDGATPAAPPGPTSNPTSPETDTNTQKIYNTKSSKNSLNNLTDLTLPKYGKISFNKNNQSIFHEFSNQLNDSLKKLINLSIVITKPNFVKEAQIINARITKALNNYDSSFSDSAEKNETGLEKKNLGLASGSRTVTPLLSNAVLSDPAILHASNLSASEMQIFNPNSSPNKKSTIPAEFNMFKNNRATTFLSRKIDDEMHLSQLKNDFYRWI